jgi:hypothetical protein
LIAGLRFTHQKIETGSSGNLLTPVPVPSSATFRKTTRQVDWACSTSS